MAPRAGRISRTFAALLLAGASAAGAAGCGGHSASRGGAAGSSTIAADRREALLARVLAEPDDVGAWLELSAEEDGAGRPSAALDALEQAKLHRSPLGRDLEAVDRQREARLLAARGRARLARGAASAVEDLRKAKAGGAAIDEGELLSAEVAAALAEARHSDARRRREGLLALRALAQRGGAAAVARGEEAGASIADRIAWAEWLWRGGAKRAAYERMQAILQQRALGQNPALLDDATRSQWAVMSAWWRPSWRRAAPSPAMPAQLERRCAVVPLAAATAFACRPSQVLAAGVRSSATERDVLRAPHPPRDLRQLSADDRDALTAMIVRGFLEGELDDAAPALARLAEARATSGDARALPSLAARAVRSRIAGDVAAEAALQQADAARPAAASERLLLAYEHLARADILGAEPYLAELAAMDAAAPALRRLATVAEALRAPLERAGGEPDASVLEALADRAAVRAASIELDDSSTISSGAAGSAAAGSPGAPAPSDAAGSSPKDAPSDARSARLLDLAARYRSEVAVARRKAADFVATSVDAAEAWAQLGALYLLLEDPAAARAAWQAAVDKSAEPRFLRGLAVACAAARDPDAALLFMTSAAAASGDPTPVLLDVAEELVRAGSPVHALQAAKSAIELAPLELHAASLDVAVRAARALGRQDEVLALRELGAAADAPAGLVDASSPSSMERALAAEPPQLAELLWLATRWHPRSVSLRAQLLARLPSPDARRGVLVDELAALAGDADRLRRAAAVAALRALRAPPAAR